MADKRISDFDTLATVQQGQELLISAEGETYKTTVDALAAAIALLITGADILSGVDGSLVPRDGEPVPDFDPTDTIALALKKLRAMLRFEATAAALLLTGYTAPTGDRFSAVAATDTINGAFTKVQGQIEALTDRIETLEQKIS